MSVPLLRENLIELRENLKHKIRPIETVHLKNKRQKISCKLCDIDFKRVHSLNRHNASVHEGNECSICHVTYTFRDDLIHHIRTKHDKVHECKVCSFKFGDSESLLKHIDVIHEGKRLHQCTKCGYTFRNEVRLFKFYSKVFLFKNKSEKSFKNQELNINGGAHARNFFNVFFYYNI